MRRMFWLSGLFALVMGFIGALLAMLVALPAVVDAQANRLRAEQVAVAGDTGADRVRLQTGPGVASSVRLFDANGNQRAMLSTGGQERGDDPEAAGINFLNSSGTQVIRLGTGHGPLSNGPLVQGLQLTDQQGQQRASIRVAEDGSPAIILLDGGGNVIWSAP
jgi:hypothetical protein